MNAVEFRNVWEKYRIKFIREGKVSWDEIWALADISLCVRKGEILGIIGKNGSGKTTLLKLIAGMLLPDKGDVGVSGRVATLMELGAGFNTEFTGRENIILNAKMYGFVQEALDARMDDIVAFAGLDKFIDAPIKYYSQGIYMRLVFALAIFVEPDILLVDDILAVGDHEAQEKCFKKMSELRESGKTIVLVSHDMDMVSLLCHRVILLQKGKIVKQGLPGEVISYYLKTTGDKNESIVPDRKKIPFLKVEPLSIKIEDFSLCVDVAGKIVRLYHKDTELTRGTGLHGAFYASQDGVWHVSGDAKWSAQKFSDTKMALTLDYEPLSLNQVWTFSFPKEGHLKIDIVLNTGTAIFLTNQRAGIEIDPKFSSWATPQEEGNFIKAGYVSGIAPVRLKDSKVSEVLLLSQKDSLMPSFVFSSVSQPGRQILSLYKRRYQKEECFCINFSKIIPHKEGLIEPGTYSYFQGDIFLESTLSSKNSTPLFLSPDAKKAGSRVVFNEGRLRFFYKDKELTSGLCGYTSLRASGIWYDSYQAAWEVLDSKDGNVLRCGYWPYLPVSQVWRVTQKDENTFEWSVEMEVYEEVALELEQTNLMLIKDYNFWSSFNGCHGDFRDGFTQDYDILPFRFWSGKTEQLCAVDKIFPKIIFLNSLAADPVNGIIENSDNLYQARLLQYQATPAVSLSAGKYPYFTGVIRIEPI